VTKIATETATKTPPAPEVCPVCSKEFSIQGIRAHEVSCRRRAEDAAAKKEPSEPAQPKEAPRVPRFRARREKIRAERKRASAS
jgi:pyrimidine deaminase RibD-like protein